MVKKLSVQVTVCALIIFFIHMISGNQAKVANQTDLNKIMDVITEHHGIVHEWSVLAREELKAGTTIAELERMAKKWQQLWPQFAWKQEIIGDKWYFTGILTDPALQYAEKLQIAANLMNETAEGFILYEINGTEWNHNVKQIADEMLLNRLSKTFHKQPTIFSCIEGEFDAIISNIAQKSKQLNETVNGKIIEKLEENNFISLTIESPLFYDGIPSDKGTINLQFALRKNDKDSTTTFVIGTPILTIEY